MSYNSYILVVLQKIVSKMSRNSAMGFCYQTQMVILAFYYKIKAKKGFNKDTVCLRNAMTKKGIWDGFEDRARGELNCFLETELLIFISPPGSICARVYIMFSSTPDCVKKISLVWKQNYSPKKTNHISCWRKTTSRNKFSLRMENALTYIELIKRTVKRRRKYWSLQKLTLRLIFTISAP